MGLKIKEVIEVKITTSSVNEILKYIRKSLKKTKSEKKQVEKKRLNPLIIFTPNPEIITYAQKNPFFRQIVNSAQINIPDGVGIVWAVKKLHGVEIKRISGVDLMENLCRLAVKKAFVVGLIGGRDGVALKALDCLKEKYQGLTGWAMDGPVIRIENFKSKLNKKLDGKILNSQTFLNSKFLTFNLHGGKDRKTNNYFRSLIKKIETEKTKILFVALGFPKQEYFIENLKSQMINVKFDKPLVMMAVGGAFDYLSGRLPRAPEWMRERGMEWLYRLIRQPRRLPRQIKGAEFFWKIIIKGNK